MREMMDVLLRTENKSALAKALGISRPTLSRYIEDPDTMPLKLVRSLARIKGYKLQIISYNHTYE